MGQNNLATNTSALHRTKMQSEKCQKKITTAHWFFLYHIARRMYACMYYYVTSILKSYAKISNFGLYMSAFWKMSLSIYP